MSDPIIRYPLDSTGLSSTNLVSGESHTLSAYPIRVVAPTYGAYFTESLVITDVVNNRTLLRGTHYNCVELLTNASADFGKEICYLILITDPSVGSTVSIRYQVLGGLYGNTTTAIANLYSLIQSDNRPINWVSIINQPYAFTPTNHLHDLKDVYGFQYLVDAIERLRSAVLVGSTPSFDNLINWVNSTLAGFQNTVNNQIAGLASPYATDTFAGNVKLNLNLRPADATDALRAITATGFNSLATNNGVTTPNAVQTAILAGLLTGLNLDVNKIALGSKLSTSANNLLLGFNATPTSGTVTNEITLGDANITRLRVPGLGVSMTTGNINATTFTGNLQGNAFSASNVAGTGVNGTTLAPGVVISSLTSVGTLTSLNVAGTGTFNTYATIGSGAAVFYADGSNSAIRAKTPTGAIYFQDSTGTVTLGSWDSTFLNVTNRLRLSSGSSNAPSLTFAQEGSSDTGLYWPAEGKLGISTNGTYRAQFGDGGLDVIGSVSASVGLNSPQFSSNGHGSIYDPYGSIAVTDVAGANNYSYYGLTRFGNIGVGFGITGTNGALGLGENAIIIGNSTSRGSADGGIINDPWIAFNKDNFKTSGAITATDIYATTFHGNFTGTYAGTVDANILTGNTLNAGVKTSSLTSVGTLSTLYTSGIVRFTTPTADSGGLTGILANPNGWSRIDPNNSSFIITTNLTTDVNTNRIILSMQDLTNWTTKFSLTAAGNMTLAGTVYATTFAGNVSGTLGGYGISTGVGAANKIVVTDSNGYISGSYFSGTDSGTTGAAGVVSGIMTKWGDNFYRTTNAASIATYLSGQTMNIVGSSTSTTGNAATATNLSTNRTNWTTNGTLTAVVGQLAWNIFGAGHTIFDASKGLAPDGTVVNNTNVVNNWIPTYPTLMGYNGTTTFGLRVDSARVADSATTAGTAGSVAWTNVVGRIAAVSQLSNDSGYLVSSGIIDRAVKLSGPAHTNGIDGWFRSDGATGWYNETYQVGIYSTSPGVVSLVNGDNFIAGFAGLGSTGQFCADAINTGVRAKTNGGAIYFQNFNGSGTWGIWNADSLLLQTRLQCQNGSVATPSLIFDYGDTDTGFSWGGDGIVNVTCNGVYTASFKPSQFYVQGQVITSNDIVAYYSDDRLKERTGKVENALDKISTLDTFYYYPNQTAMDLGYEKIHQIGVSAQQMQAILPEVVKPAPIDNKYLTVQYEKIVPLLIAGINEQSVKITTLEDTIASMSKDIEMLKKLLIV